MDILIKNCNLISMSEGRPRYEEDISIYIENGVITEIGEEIIPHMGAYIIDARGKVCMPGLINAHTHLSMSIFRETLDGYTLQDWLTKKIWPMEDKLTRDDIYYASLLSCAEMISTGTTCANDQYFMAEETIRAAIELGARLEVTRTVNDANGMQYERMEELEELVEKYRNRYDLITLNVGIHGLYTTGRDTTKQMVEFAKENELPIHMHFCENQKEVEDIRRIHEVESPVEALEDYFIGTHTILAHCVKLTDEEIKKIAKLDMNVVHCPISNLRLGCGISKVQKMLDEGVNVALGTDGQGSGSNLDMFDTMKFTALLQKGVFENSKNMDSYEVLKMATINGAKALGLDREIGSIEEGKKADIILIDQNTEVTNPVGTIFANLVYNTKGGNVSHTIINGKLVMEDRQIEGIDKYELFQKCKEIIARISE